MSGASLPAATGVSRLPELDLLRGFAALLMVFNHVGYAALDTTAATSGLAGAIVLFGSMAPVVFFFATGVGCGLATRPPAWRSVAKKFLLLVLADQFMGWSSGKALTLDFFGFIAISMVVAQLVMVSSRPVVVAGLSAAVVLLLRYGAGKPLDALAADYSVLRWILGVTALDGVSYPAAPWLVYPLLGLAVGVRLRHPSKTLSVKNWAALATVALFCALAATGLVWSGSSLHRWGSVSAAFFALSIAVVLGAASVSVAVSRRAPKIAAVLSLGGVASFFVVPVHYVIVRGGAIGVHEGIGSYLAIASSTAAASFVIANALERASESLTCWPSRRVILVVAFLVISVAAPLSFAFARRDAPAAALLFATAGQLAIGLLFAWRVRSVTYGRAPAR